MLGGVLQQNCVFCICPRCIHLVKERIGLFIRVNSFNKVVASICPRGVNPFKTKQRVEYRGWPRSEIAEFFG